MSDRTRAGTPTKEEISCLIAGLKGLEFFKGLLEIGILPRHVVSYEQPDDLSRSFAIIEEIAESHDITFEEKKRPYIFNGELVFVVGWQYFLPSNNLQLIIFHDSLLPRYRGFAPTVTALINGEKRIGVSALRPVDGVDQGPLFGQLAAPVTYPMKIEAALSLQAQLMVSLACELIEIFNKGTLRAEPQAEDQATYSLWRDEQDYVLDWREDAARLARSVDALGFPYSGARALFDGREIIIDEAEEVDDLHFEHRQAGKIWSLNDGRPIVICGVGCMQINAARELDSAPVTFDRLRRRFSKTSRTGMQTPSPRPSVLSA